MSKPSTLTAQLKIQGMGVSALLGDPLPCTDGEGKEAQIPWQTESLISHEGTFDWKIEINPF